MSWLTLEHKYSMSAAATYKWYVVLGSSLPSLNMSRAALMPFVRFMNRMYCMMTRVTSKCGFCRHLSKMSFALSNSDRSLKKKKRYWKASMTEGTVRESVPLGSRRRPSAKEGCSACTCWWPAHTTRLCDWHTSRRRRGPHRGSTAYCARADGALVRTRCLASPWVPETTKAKARVQSSGISEKTTVYLDFFGELEPCTQAVTVVIDQSLYFYCLIHDSKNLIYSNRRKVLFHLDETRRIAATRFDLILSQETVCTKRTDLILWLQDASSRFAFGRSQVI